MNKLQLDQNEHAILSSSLLNVPKSATLAINEISKKLIFEGKDVVRMGLGQSPFPVPEAMVESLRQHADAKDYMAVQGYLPLREAISAFLQRTENLDYSCDNIIVGPGSKELFFGLQMVLDCDLLLPAPSWVSYQPQARLLGRNVHWLPCEARNGWKLTPDALEQHCRQHSSRPQLLVLNSPNNPSGACFTEQELTALASVARRYNIIILSDEIYSELHYTGGHLSVARFYPEATIVSNGISKWAGAGGWRLGFMAIPDSLPGVLQAMVVVASETYTSVSAPIQMAAISAFEPSSQMQNYILACRKIMRGIGLQFSQRLVQHEVNIVEPDGGFYILADFTSYREALLQNGISQAAELAQQLLDKTGVATLPGSDFGFQRELLLRFAFVDFDGASLLDIALKDPQLIVDENITELSRIFSAADRIGAWLKSL